MFGINLLSEQDKKLAPEFSSHDSWQKEVKEAIKTTSELEAVLKTTLPKTNYSIFIPKKLGKKIFEAGPNSSLWKQFVPHANEKKLTGLEDPIGDHKHSRPGRIIHRYKNRILFFPTPICPVNCRYCFRKNELSEPDDLFKGRLDETLKYLNDHPEVNEVILSGGDPLILNDEKLENIFQRFSQISSIKYLRLHTRTPVIIPSRASEGLISLFKEYKKKFKKILIVIHINHIDEMDAEVTAALIKFKQTQVEVLAQSVLLKNINDNTKDLASLFTYLSEIGVRPYYLHHPDRVKGAMHFYLSLTEGRMLYHSLRNILPGWMIPQYVIDIPGGEGKVPAFNPEDFDFSGKLINKDAQTVQVTPLT